MTALPARVELSPDVLVQEVAGEAVLLDLNSEKYFGLNDVGVRLWRLIETSGDPEAAIGALLEDFEVDESQLRADVARHLAVLSERGLIRIVS